MYIQMLRWLLALWYEVTRIEWATGSKGRRGRHTCSKAFLSNQIDREGELCSGMFVFGSVIRDG